MNPTNPSPELGLQDIHLPAAVSAWPPALGWWLLALLIIATITIVFIAIKQYRKKWGYRKAALHLLKQHYQQWKHQDSNKQESNKYTTQALMETLKRCAMAAYPDAALSALYGKQWVNFLNQQTRQPYFNDQLSKALIEQQYKANPSIDIEALYQACQHWVKQHRTRISPNHRQKHMQTYQTEEAKQC